MKKKILFTTTSKKMLADVFTPVGIYLRLRDRFRDTILLESADFRAGENSYSFIGINAIGGIEISGKNDLEFKFPGQEPLKKKTDKETDIPTELWAFMQQFHIEGPAQNPERFAQGLFGYTSYEAVQFFENISFEKLEEPAIPAIPLIRYRLYQYVIAINHFKNEMFLCENHFKGIESNIDLIENIIKNKDVPRYPFTITEKETSDLTDEEYIKMVQQGIEHCGNGNIFQIVLSRKFKRSFLGDEFNVYRALRSINPSPYLFYFDYGDYRIFGSSPESQLIVKNNQAVVHPIAGTFRRTGNETVDRQSAHDLLNDKKENAEHVMLVDLARNDLSRSCNHVKVNRFCEVQYFSHVIHLVSEVQAATPENANPFKLLGDVFPAGTLSGAPKIKAMQLINNLEGKNREYYGGCIGFVGFDGSINQAIMIRTFLSRDNTLTYQAGAGITISSIPENEVKEVHNKLNALKTAIESATQI